MRPPPAHKDVPESVFSSNPFVFKQFCTLLRNGASPTPFPSITSALFPMQWRGGGVSLAHPLPIRDSPHATVSPVLATHPKNRQLTPLFATHPIAGSCKSLNSHTYDTPRGVFDGRIAGQRRAALLVLGHQSPFTSHQSPPSVPLRWPSRSARIGIVRDDTCLWPLTWAKRWETKPLLPVSKNGSGQTGPASCSAPCPVKGFRRRRNRKSCLGTSFYSL
jgi:hypothetical protein